jgi:hypothetical protein
MAARIFPMRVSIRDPTLDPSMRRFSVFVLLALSLASLGIFRPASVDAGTAVKLDLAGLVDRADLVLEGRVVAERVLMGPANRIDTEYTISVERTFWGSALPTRVFRMPGGVLPDGRGMVLPGMPRLSTGASALLFLTAADPTGMRMPVGLAQGELAIITDAAGQKRIVRDTSDLSLLDPRTGAPTQADAKAVLDYAATVAEIEARAAAKLSRARALAPVGGSQERR